MPESFYEPNGELHVATELTRGPWDPKAQHAGPPAALIGREVELLGGGRIGGEDGPPAQVGRITYEVLRSVPIAPLRVEAKIVRPGRRVSDMPTPFGSGRVTASRQIHSPSGGRCR